MNEDALYTDPSLAQFYDLENGWTDDFNYCTALAENTGSVLDLGCGTGQLLAAIAGNQRAVGVDSAAAMLNIAQQREGGHRAEWIQADARTLDLNERFDLILLTSHAFQVFLTDEDQRAALRTIRRHLSPTGRFVFDSRNPALKPWERWTPAASKRSLVHPKLGEVIVWNDAQFQAHTQIVNYQTIYQPKAQSETFSANARIRFTPHLELAHRIEEAGLTVSKWLGGWNGIAFSEHALEIIPIGRLAP